MLWKKESRQPDALYMDIFEPDTQQWDSFIDSELQKIEQKPHPVKSNAIALEKRNEGNLGFHISAPLKAMELYNDCLRFANPGSEHISLAYANRSACFLQMKMYDECLADIELAKQADYPEHLRPKLDERKTRCLKDMQKDPKYPREKLSIEPNEIFSYLSNEVMVQRNEKGVFSVTANTDIDVGQPIGIEDAYHTYVPHSFGLHCNICSKECCNLVPCGKCASAMFCPECQGHFLHEHECGLNFCGESDFNSTIMCSVRSNLFDLKSFTNADEMMSFVEQSLKKPNELPENVLDDRSKYQTFLNCPLKRYDASFDRMKPNIYTTYKTLLRIPYVNEMFKTAKHRRFLMHLIGHHMMIVEVGVGLHTGSGTRQDRKTASVFISPVLMSYITHACMPNVHSCISGGKTVFFTMKPIKKGEQLFISCLPNEIESLHSTEERKEIVFNMFRINCECSRCQGKIATSMQRQQLVSEPAYRYIKSNVESFYRLELNSKQPGPLMDACKTILRWYGQMDWCSEMHFILNCFQLLYIIRSTGGGTDFNHPMVQNIFNQFKFNSIG